MYVYAAKYNKITLKNKDFFFLMNGNTISHMTSNNKDRLVRQAY